MPSINLTEHITPLLEVLRRAEASLRDEPYEFMDWTMCTCGHIYTATTGQRATRPSEVMYSEDVTFRQVVRYIVDATGGLSIHDDLKPRAISVEGEEEGALVFDPDQLRAFLVWPPSEGAT